MIRNWNSQKMHMMKSPYPVLGALVSFSYLLLDIFFKKDIYEKEQTKHKKEKRRKGGKEK